MQGKISESSIIPTNLLSLISGGRDDNPQAPQPTSPTVTVVGGGNATVAGGAVIGTIPINANTQAVSYVSLNTVQGITGAGIGANYKF